MLIFCIESCANRAIEALFYSFAVVKRLCKASNKVIILKLIYKKNKS